MAKGLLKYSEIAFYSAKFILINMARWLKGGARRIVRGSKGPSQKALIRTFEKNDNRIRNRTLLMKLPPSERGKFAFRLAMKKYQTVMFSKALSGAGLTDRALRKEVHTLGQMMIGHFMKVNFPKNKESVQKAIEALEALDIKIHAAITRSNGEEAAIKFDGLTKKHYEAINEVRAKLELRREIKTRMN